VRILLLGATGFIGTNLLPGLLASGCEVYAVTRKTGAPAGVKSTDIAAGLHWLPESSLLEGTKLPPLDAILSAAGVGAPSLFEMDPIAGLEAELQIADRVCQLAVKHQVARIISISSAGAVYGEGWKENRRTTFQEKDICSPISVYGKCKLASEQRLVERLNAARLGDRLVILRVSNIYGLHYHKNGRQGLVNNLIDHALAHQPITIYGDGLIYRDYLYSSDLASAILNALRGKSSGVFNIAAGCSHSILDVIAEVEQAAGEVFQREYAPARGFDVRCSALSIAQAKETLGWSPMISLRGGIDLLLEHRRRLLQPEPRLSGKDTALITQPI
jgi:UDP-glucose 4-epimerase